MIWQKVTMKTTSLIISILVISLGVYDLFAVISSHGQASISSFFFQLGFQAPFCVFVIGFICGHFFGYMRLEKANTELRAKLREQIWSKL